MRLNSARLWLSSWMLLAVASADPNNPWVLEKLAEYKAMAGSRKQVWCTACMDFCVDRVPPNQLEGDLQWLLVDDLHAVCHTRSACSADEVPLQFTRTHFYSWENNPSSNAAGTAPVKSAQWCSST